NGVLGCPRCERCAAARDVGTAMATTAKPNSRVRSERLRNLIRVVPRALLVAPHLRHAIARFSTRSAHIRAVLELLVALNASARFFACSAELGASSAGDDVIG